MPFRPFLNGQEFDQETICILGVAFEQVGVALRIGDCDDDVKHGERSPDRLCERALDIRQPQV